MASLFLKAGGGPHAPYFPLLAQRKVSKGKGTPRLALRCAAGSLRSSEKRGAHESLRSDIRFFHVFPAVLGCAKGTGYSVVTFESLSVTTVVGSVHQSRLQAAEQRSSPPD